MIYHRVVKETVSSELIIASNEIYVAPQGTPI